jgi:hypothetical protein
MHGAGFPTVCMCKYYQNNYDNFCPKMVNVSYFLFLLVLLAKNADIVGRFVTDGT